MRFLVFAGEVVVWLLLGYVIFSLCGFGPIWLFAVAVVKELLLLVFFCVLVWFSPLVWFCVGSLAVF